jgi:hypothetical protein
MVSLGLKENYLADVSFVRIKLATSVVLQPLPLEWDAMIEKGNLYSQTALEHGLNKYSSLTAGSTIYIEVDGLELPLLVKEKFAEGSVSVKGILVQDSDIIVDIDRGHQDKLIKLQELEAELIVTAEVEDR